MPPHHSTPSVKSLEATLRDLNYTHHWKRIKGHEARDLPDYRIADKTDLHDILLDNTKRPLCQNVDIILPSDQEDASLMYTNFMKMLGERCAEQDFNYSLSSANAKSDSESLAELDDVSYEQNDEQRYYQLQEFIDTEANYVKKLKAMVELIVNRLDPEARKARREPPIIHRFEYKNIFLNVQEILKVNESFMCDLRKCNTGAADDMCFGEVCESHMAHFGCYRNFSLGVEQARRLHGNEIKNNVQYRRFLDTSLSNPVFDRLKLLDVLTEPPVRLTRYTLMIKDILKHTPASHRDYHPLKRAYVKACSIASMEDDDATKLATMCHRIFQSFKNTNVAPSNLISQHRSFIAQLDAVETHRTKGIEKRPVTFFLFTDKLLIAERPNYDCQGIDLLEGKRKPGVRVLKKDQKLRFKGWIDIEQAQIFEGDPANQSSFLLFASTAQKHGRGPVPTTESHEEFFRRGIRLFTVPPRDDESPDDCLKRTADFVSTFQHAQALAKRYDAKDEAYFRQWCDLHVYSNVYDTVSYTRANYKSNIAVVYLEHGKAVNLRSLFPSGTTPLIVALVHGSPDGFRFSTWSQIALPLQRDILESIPLNAAVSDDGRNVLFESVFWNNVVLCERHLRASEQFVHAHIDDLDARPRHRSRSRSLTRSTSIPSLGAWFNSSSSRSRSMSPSRGAVKPTSSRSSPIGSQGILTFGKKARSRSSSMTSSSSGTLARTLTSHSSSSSVEHQRPVKIAQRKSLPAALHFSSETVLPKPIVSSPQDDYDLANKFADSRPSSRSSTRSSSASSFAYSHAYGPFSNPVSLASHSTRSSLSLDDLELAKHSPSPPPARMYESGDDSQRKKMQQLLGTSKKPRNAPFSTRDERSNGFVVSSVGLSTHASDQRSQIIDRCRKLTEQLVQVSDTAQSRPADSEYNFHFNNRLDDIESSIDSFRSERRRSHSTVLNPEAFFERKLKEAHAERDSLDRYMSDLQNRMFEYGRQQSTT